MTPTIPKTSKRTTTDSVIAEVRRTKVKLLERFNRCQARRRRAPTSTLRERAVVEMKSLRHFIGTPPKVASLIRQVVEDVQVDEVMVTSIIYGQNERRRSYELLAAEWGLAPRTSGVADATLRTARS